MPNGILICGNDHRLQQTREIVLKTAHFPVSSVLGVRGVDAALEGPAANLIVLCHSLSIKERDEIISKVNRYWPGSKMLALTTLPGAHDIEDCEIFEAFRGPKAFVDRVRQLIPLSEAS